jgi:hypothetical protein
MPAQNSGAPGERVAASFKQLSTAANYLNKVSDSLGESIQSMNARLARLNIGMSAWIKFAEQVDEDTGQVIVYELGYADLAPYGTWCIAIRSVLERHGDEPIETVKRFNDVSRDLRLQSVCKIPDLIDKLRKTVEDKAAEIKPTMDQVNEFAAALDLAIESQESA